MNFDDLINDFLNEQDFTVLNGIAKDKTSEDIAEKWSVSIEEVNRAIEDGIKIEMEHTKNKDAAKLISMDHLWELGLGYYVGLDKLETSLKKKAKKQNVKENANLAGPGGVFGSYSAGTQFSGDTYAPGDTRIPKALGAKRVKKGKGKNKKSEIKFTVQRRPISADGIM